MLFVEVGPRERKLSRHQLACHDAQRVHIGLYRGPLAGEAFRRGPLLCPTVLVGDCGGGFLGVAGDAEISQAPITAVSEDVLRLDVAVNDHATHIQQCRRHVRQDRDDIGLTELTFCSQILIK